MEHEKMPQTNIQVNESFQKSDPARSASRQSTHGTEKAKGSTITRKSVAANQVKKQDSHFG